jgi:hypothetical protein
VTETAQSDTSDVPRHAVGPVIASSAAMPDLSHVSSEPTSLELVVTSDMSVDGDGAADTEPRVAQTHEPYADESLGRPTAHAWGYTGELPLLGRASKAATHAWLPAQYLGVPDTSLDAFRVGQLETRAVSTRGLEHRLHGTARQDAYCIGTSEARDWLFLAVCDGLGSAPLSHRGSELASRVAIRVLSGLTAGWAADWPSAASEVTETVRAELISQVDDPRDIATTMVFAAVAVASVEDAHAAYLGRVGDSTALHLTGANSLRDVFADELSPLFHSSATACLPLNPEALTTRHLRLGGNEALVLATDGFFVPAVAPDRVGYFAQRWAQAPGLDAILVDVQFIARTYDDDRTVAGVWVAADGVEVSG